MKEGSFEGLMSGLDFNQDPEISKIKTPDQLPDKVDFTALPENISRSAVVESLINQNDDLMARLNVALRRVSNLEEKISDARTESAQYKAKYENVKDQILILREQSRLLSDRYQQTEEKTKRENRDTDQLKEQIQVLEIRYAELYQTAETRRTRLEQELAIHKRAVKRFQKYRMNLKRAIATAKEELRFLREKKSGFEATLQDLRHNISETTTYISTQAKEHKQQLQSLSEAYETEILQLKNNLAQATETNQTLTARTQEIDRLFGEKVRLENDLVIAQRREEDLRLQTAVEVSDLQKSLGRFRNEAKELALQAESYGAEILSAKNQIAGLTEEKHNLTEQVETLQLLWRDQQTQMEKLTEQKNALQKLNQELSISINEYRRETRELKEKLESETIKLLEAQKSRGYQAKLKNTVASAAENASVNTQGAEAPTIKRTDSLAPELMEKIDKVLTNLHVGR